MMISTNFPIYLFDLGNKWLPIFGHQLVLNVEFMAVAQVVLKQCNETFKKQL